MFLPMEILTNFLHRIDFELSHKTFGQFSKISFIQHKTSPNWSFFSSLKCYTIHKVDHLTVHLCFDQSMNIGFKAWK